MKAKRTNWSLDTPLKELAEAGCTVRELLALVENEQAQEQKDTIESNRSKENIKFMVRISNLLKEVGVPQHIKGYGYARTAIKMGYDNPEMVSDFTTKMYPAVAEKYGMRIGSVDRGLRTAIEYVWNNGDAKVLKKYFGNIGSGTKSRPTNNEFIATLVDVLLLEDGKIEY